MVTEQDKNTGDAYAFAQRTIPDLKIAAHMVLIDGPSTGLRNVDLGRTSEYMAAM